MSENVGASTSRNPKGLYSLYRDNFTFMVNKCTGRIKIRSKNIIKLLRIGQEVKGL
jgi:hypothetical protein